MTSYYSPSLDTLFTDFGHIFSGDEINQLDSLAIEHRSSLVPLHPLTLLNIFPEALPVFLRHTKATIKQLKAEIKDLTIERRDLSNKRSDGTRSEREWYDVLMENRQSEIDQKAKEVRKLESAILLAAKPQAERASIGEKISRAKQMPIENFLKITPAGFANCPFHHEHTASLKYYRKDNRYHCFGCGAHGDVIDLIQHLMNYSFADALDYLAK